MKVHFVHLGPRSGKIYVGMCTTDNVNQISTGHEQFRGRVMWFHTEVRTTHLTVGSVGLLPTRSTVGLEDPL